jgi:hypothetical protein
VAAVRDLEFDAYAYGNVLAYNMLTALYLVLISRTKASTKLSTFGMMQYNNLVCIPALAGLCLVDGSFSYVRAPKHTIGSAIMAARRHIQQPGPALM